MVFWLALVLATVLLLVLGLALDLGLARMGVLPLPLSLRPLPALLPLLRLSRLEEMGAVGEEPCSGPPAAYPTPAAE